MADALLMHLTLSKLSSATRLKWQESAGREISTWNDFERFMEDRAPVLERCKVLETKPPAKPAPSGSKPLMRQQSRCSALLTSDVVTCPYCSVKGHLIQYCPKFLACEVSKRISEARRLMFCIVCLKRGHFAASCKSKGCEICKKKHHTALHLISNASNSAPSTPESTQSSPVSSLAVRDNRSTAIIGTMLVKLGADNGQEVLCRALLDLSSTCNFLSTKIAQILRPQRAREFVNVTGIGSASISVKESCSVVL